MSFANVTCACGFVEACPATRAGETAEIQVEMSTGGGVTGTVSKAGSPLNGVQVGSKAVSGNMKIGSGPLRIGGNSLWGEYFQGKIDEVRVYNRALTASQIRTDMTTPVR